jgi:hypothetical protein
MVGSWQVEGELSMTEHWRSVVPDLSVDLAEDQTDIANDRRRVESVRQRYALELKHLGGRKRSGSTSLTRISDWVPLTSDERQAPRPRVPFALCRGVASVLVEPAPGRLEDGLDYAIRVQVGPGLLPHGPLLLDGVPLVIHAQAPNRPLPANADELWPHELLIPKYRD